MSAAAVLPFPEQRRFGRYVVLGRIGSGGMAEAHLAFAACPGGAERLVVVKTLHAHLAEDDACAAMFFDEARALSAVSHPSLLQIFDSGIERGDPYIVVEYLDGLSLSEVAVLCSRAKRPPPPSIVVHIIAEVAAGLAHAHEARALDGTPLAIVHRDVSPSNVMVLRSGNAKLIDFGVAKTTRNIAVTDVGCVKGKPRFVAPEQLRGARPTAGTDVWALGVLLWEMLTQRRLFNGLDMVDVMMRVKRDRIPAPSEHAPRVDALLDTIVASALERDPASRCTMSELRNALVRWLSLRCPHVGPEQVAAFVGEVGQARLAERSAQVREWLEGAGLTRRPPPPPRAARKPHEKRRRGLPKVSPDAPLSGSAPLSTGEVPAAPRTPSKRAAPPTPSSAPRATHAEPPAARRATLLPPPPTPTPTPGTTGKGAPSYTPPPPARFDVDLRRPPRLRPLPPRADLPPPFPAPPPAPPTAPPPARATHRPPPLPSQGSCDAASSADAHPTVRMVGPWGG
ncbi:MAG: serine/threonine protein kinase [Myxococcales bacterium]|nr:serine/threonine protein kinase [Myxococcales bacterium]